MGRPEGWRAWQRRAARAGAALAASIAPLLLAATPASAHASLIVSTPADGDVLAAAPKSIHLTFSEAVQLPLSRFDLQRPDASQVPLGAAQAVSGKPDEVDFALNNLGRGNYIFTWHAATRDTHIASGQFQFSLGAPLGRGLSGSGGGFSPFAWASGLSRYLWYMVVGLTAGLLFSLQWVRRPAARGGAARAPAATLEFRRLLARGLRLVGPAIVVVSILRLTMLLIQAATNAGASTGASTAMDKVITSYQGRLWVVIIAVATLLFVLTQRVLRTSRGSSLRSFGPPAAVLVLLCGLEAASGHAATRSTPIVPIAITGLHLAAVSLWAGTLVTFVLITSRRSYRTQPAADRTSLRRSFLGAFSPVATVSLAILVVTGVLLGAISLGPIGKLFATTYGTAVATKIGLLCVAAGIGLYHRLTYGGRRRAAPAQRSAGTGTVQSRRFAGLTVPVEAVVLLAAVAVAAGLTGLQPAGQLITYRAAEAKAHQVVADPRQCLSNPSFVLGCWTRYFDATVKKSGAEYALDRLSLLNNTGGPQAVSQCHQLAHEVGRAAARRYPTLYESLKAGQTLGNLCDSGYWHGLLEATISSMDDPTLAAKLNSICLVPGIRRYSFDNFNCVHGLGHGVTLRYSEDVFQALPWCDKFTDSWDQQSCYGGVFMQNIIADQAEGGAVDLKASDPIYPCDAVPDRQKTQCYEIQTSNVLKVKNQDYHAAFIVCDGVDKAYVDTCYRSMGRDISGAALLDPAKELSLCQKATNQAGLDYCIRGAVANNVDSDHNALKATALCQMVPAAVQAACIHERDTSLSLL